MRHSIKALCAAGVVTAGLFMGGSARADIIPTLTSVTPAGGGNFLWSYNATLSGAENAVTNNFFTIYDIQGLVAGSEATSGGGWVTGDQLTGVTAPLTTPTDSASLRNVTYYYGGAPTILGPQSSLGTFTFLSTQGVLHVGQFTAVAINNSGPNAGTLVSNIGSVSVPGPSATEGGPSVPLPAALPVGLALLAVIGLVSRKLPLGSLS